MTVNIAALEKLLPARAARTQGSGGSTGTNTLRGPFPYDALRNCGLDLEPLLVGVIETVRNNPRWGPLYRGDISAYGGDHSAADLALCGEFARRGLPSECIDTAFRTSALYRPKWERDDYRGHTISLAMHGDRTPSDQNSSLPSYQSAATGLLARSAGRIKLSPAPPPPRQYVVENLLVTGSVAVLAALSGSSKTQAALQMGAAVARGASFGGRPTRQGRVMFVSGEEDKSECERRICAMGRREGLPQSELDRIEDNMSIHDLVSEDIRLTVPKAGGALDRAPFVDEIIRSSGSDTVLIIVDHAGLVHGGDFNAKNHAAITMRTLSEIARRTGAAVILIAHSPKSAASQEAADASMIFGSAAFVEQARGGFVMMPMTSVQAKAFGIKDTDRRNYISFNGVKSNYTPGGQELWFRRESQDEVGVLEHVVLTPPASKANGGAGALELNILQEIGRSPGRYSKTNLRDQFSGKAGPWGASKHAVEHAIDDLLHRGQLISRAPTPAECQQFGHGPQVKRVLDLGHKTGTTP